MSITVRQATPNDAELLARLNQPIQQQHADALPHIFKPACVTEALIERFRHVLAAPENVAYVIEVDGVPAGYMVCVLNIAPENPFAYEQRILVIDQISVNPEFKRRGCGRRLMDAARALANERQVNRITLTVWAFNEEAIEFYRDRDFEVFRYTMYREIGL